MHAQWLGVRGPETSAQSVLLIDCSWQTDPVETEMEVLLEPRPRGGGTQGDPAKIPRGAEQR